MFRRYVVYLATDVCRGHRRARVSAVEQQAEGLFTTQSRSPHSAHRRWQANRGRHPKTVLGKSFDLPQGSVPFC